MCLLDATRNMLIPQQHTRASVTLECFTDLRVAEGGKARVWGHTLPDGGRAVQGPCSASLARPLLRPCAHFVLLRPRGCARCCTGMSWRAWAVLVLVGLYARRSGC